MKKSSYIGLAIIIDCNFVSKFQVKNTPLQRWTWLNAIFNLLPEIVDRRHAWRYMAERNCFERDAALCLLFDNDSPHALCNLTIALH